MARLVPLLVKAQPGILLVHSCTVAMRIAIFLLGVLVTPVASAQLGVRVHTVSVWQEADRGARYHGVGVAVFAELEATSAVAVELSAGYTQSGFDDTQIGRTSGTESPREFFTITISSRAHLLTFSPVVLVRRPRGHVRPYVFAGPRLDVTAHQTRQVDDGPRLGTDAYTFLNWGGSVGLGTGVPVGQREVLLDIRGSRLRVLDGGGEWTAELRAGFRF